LRAVLTVASFSLFDQVDKIQKPGGDL